MDRRNFLKAGAATGLTAAAAAPAAQATPLAALPKPGRVPDMDEYVAKVDAGLARIDAWSITADKPGFAGDRAATDALARTALQSLFVTGMLGDLPPEQQADPRMQDCVWGTAPRLGEAMDRMEQFLATRTEDDLARVQAALRDPAGMAERVADALDEQAELSGVSEWRRQQLRGTLMQAAWRLTNQPPALVIDEYRDKLRRVSASGVEVDAVRHHFGARLGERLFWDRAASAGGVVSIADVTDPPRNEHERLV